MGKPTLYHLQDSRSFRIEWLLQELNVDHDLVYSKRQANKAPQNFKSAHPMGKAPMLVLDDGKTIIAESGAVCEYILEAYASQEQRMQFLGGESPLDHANVRSWAYYSEGTLLLHALSITYSRWFLPDSAKDALPEMERNLAPNVNNDLKYLETTLASSSSGFLFGDHLTLADIMVAFSAHFVLVRGLGAKWADSSYPHIKKWIRMLQARPAWQKAVESGEDSYTLDKLGH